MYYQVLIVTTEGEKIHIVDNENETYILEKIVVPYLLEEEFYVEGFALTKKSIKRLKIGLSDNSAKQIADYENQTMPVGVLFVVSAEDIVNYKNYVKDVTNEFLEKGKNFIKTRDGKMINKNSMDMSKVFIVHGHDDNLINEVALFLKKLGVEPIVLREQPNRGMTIIEKIEEYSNVGFGIVLYTPCDIGYDREHPNAQMGRARQNVVFEHGYLIGKLGRERVCALVKDNVEKPNDISGVVYINYDNGGVWKYSIAKEMRSIGYTVDLNNI